jgi:hypothetical protein
MSYSQNDEEKNILRLFMDHPAGRLLDIGAFHPETFSNSIALIKLGWRAILVDPNPTSVLALVEYHAKNPLVAVVGALVSPKKPGELALFHVCRDAVSTTNADYVNMWNKGLGIEFQPLWLPVVHPDTIIANQTFDFITVDVEDGTLELVEAMKPAFSHCKVACVEHSVGGNVIKSQLRKIFIDELGFKLEYESSENYVFAKCP